VRAAGLEPARISTHVPETCPSANFGMLAHVDSIALLICEVNTIFAQTIDFLWFFYNNIKGITYGGREKMSFIEDIKNRVRKDIKKVILPEAEDIRILEAADKIGKEEFAKVILIGREEEIRKLAAENNLDISKAEIIEPETTDEYESYVNAFYELRKDKGMTKEKAEELIKEPIYFGMMMLKAGKADGLVSGAAHTTADTLRPALQIIKTAPDTKIVSTFSIMVLPDSEYGADGVFLFADCGLNENPDSGQLADIAVSSAKTLKNLLNIDPFIAMLSYSTYGSAKSEMVAKVLRATEIAKQMMPSGSFVDGPLQVDSAVNETVGARKAPGSSVAGRANVFIFPDLNSGNIAYKLVERLAKAEAYGPMCQGTAKPVNDLSRGCSSEDIVGVVALTALQAQN